MKALRHSYLASKDPQTVAETLDATVRDLNRVLDNGISITPHFATITRTLNLGSGDLPIPLAVGFRPAMVWCLGYAAEGSTTNMPAVTWQMSGENTVITAISGLPSDKQVVTLAFWRTM